MNNETNNDMPKNMDNLLERTSGTNEKMQSAGNAGRELYHALRRLFRLMHRTGHPGSGPHGLFRGQAHLLTTIMDNEGIIQRDLAEVMDIRPSSLTEMLVKMVQDGLVSRRQDEKDQRLMHIHLTEEGRTVLKAMNGSDDIVAESLFHSLTSEEAATMLTLCKKLGAGLDSESRGKEADRPFGRGGRGQDHHGGRFGREGHPGEHSGHHRSNLPGEPCDQQESRHTGHHHDHGEGNP